MVNVNNYILLCIVILISSCSINKHFGELNKEQKEVLIYIIETSKSDIFYKSINKEKNNFIHDYVTKDNLEFFLCNLDIETPFKLNDFEVSYVKRRFKDLKKVNLKKGFLNKYKLSMNKKVKGVSFISIPILFRDKTLAIIYAYQHDGGYFALYKKKENNKWEAICSESVWIE